MNFDLVTEAVEDALQAVEVYADTLPQDDQPAFWQRFTETVNARPQETS